MVSTTLAYLNVGIFGLCLLTSVMGLGLVPFFSIVLWMAMISWFYRGSIRNWLIRDHDLQSEGLRKKNLWIGWALVVIQGCIAVRWLQDIWVAPSQDDTINHLGFLQAILESGNVLLGKIDRPGAEWFGTSSYHFYPTGSHGIAALWLHLFHSVQWPRLFKAALIAIIAAWPGFMWWSCARFFPSISLPIRLLLVTAAMTQAVFPLGALGEGSISRVIAFILFVPIWFHAIRSNHGFRFGLIWTAFLAPTLLFIHPALMPLVAVAVFFFKPRGFFDACLGTLIGGPIFYWIMHSAQQEVTQPAFIENLTAGLRTDGFGWFDRLKGPFHFWFSDSLGFGKFLSLKNFFIYLGLGLAVSGKVPRKILLLFLIPFAMASLALIHHPIPQHVGLIFYHAIKRIAELTPILGLTIACFGAEVFCAWIKNKRKTLTASVHAVALIASVAYLSIFTVKSQSEIEHYHGLFHSIRTSEIESLRGKLLPLAPNDILIVDRHAFDILRFALVNKVYTLKPECAEVGTVSDYCSRRRAFGENLFHGSVPPQIDPYQFAKHGFWWMPDADQDVLITIQARERNLPVIELATDAHLIQVIRPTDRGVNLQEKNKEKSTEKK